MLCWTVFSLCVSLYLKRRLVKALQKQNSSDILVIQLKNSLLECEHDSQRDKLAITATRNGSVVQMVAQVNGSESAINAALDELLSRGAQRAVVDFEQHMESAGGGDDFTNRRLNSILLDQTKNIN